MLAVLFLAASLPAAGPAAAAPSRPGGYLAALGGAGPTLGSLDAFTQRTGSSPREEDSRRFSTSGAVGLRGGVWLPESAWGAALETSALRMPVSGGELDALMISGLLMARPRSMASRRVFPYAGLGLGMYALTARADYRPRTAAALKTTAIDPEIGLWTFDARLGVQARAAARLFLLAEARVTRFDMDRDWTPATWFGPPVRGREGIRARAFPILLQAGVGVEY